MVHKEKLLAVTENGLVIKCLCCDSIRIKFKNVLLQKISIPQFQTFKKVVDNVSLDNTCDKGDKIIYFVLSEESFLFGLDVTELFEMQDLLHVAENNIPWLKVTQS